MSVIGSVARFVYHFIFGDDWLVAVVVLLGLVATGWLVANAISTVWLVPLLAIAMTGISLRRARSRRAARPR